MVGVVAFLTGFLFRRRSIRESVPAPEASFPTEDVRLIDQSVEAVRSGFAAGRTIVWRISADGERAIPWLVRAGKQPKQVTLTGDVLGWSLRQRMPMRHETPPLWSEDSCRAAALCPIPVEHGAAILSLEFADPAALPQPGDLTRAAAYLAAFIDREDERSITAMHRRQSDALMSVLELLPVDMEPQPLAEQLADSAIELTGATGAAVMTWELTHGHVTATRGDARIQSSALVNLQESEAALAAMSGSAHPRTGRKRTLPLVAIGEAFGMQPRSFAAIPLRSKGDTVGVLTVWNQDELDADGVKSLTVLAPYAGLQFQHAQDFGKLRERAEHDRLTGLLNRQAFDHELAAEIARHDRYGRPFALLLLDLDHFKAINDKYGHPTGDAVLATVGQTITKTLREVDTAARYGGEEFAVILPETDLRVAEEIAERVRIAIAGTPANTSSGRLNVTVSIGVSSVPERATNADALIKTADTALYESKRAGRNRVSAAPEKRR